MPYNISFVAADQKQIWCIKQSLQCVENIQNTAARTYYDISSASTASTWINESENLKMLPSIAREVILNLIFFIDFIPGLFS
jgi:hypothetical protein